MAKLTAAKRKNLSTSEFAGPDRSYPVDTHNRAANAKARAKQQYEKGDISGEEYHHIVAKANRKLARTKGK